MTEERTLIFYSIPLLMVYLRHVVVPVLLLEVRVRLRQLSICILVRLRSVL